MVLPYIPAVIVVDPLSMEILSEALVPPYICTLHISTDAFVLCVIPVIIVFFYTPVCFPYPAPIVYQPPSDGLSIPFNIPEFCGVPPCLCSCLLYSSHLPRGFYHRIIDPYYCMDLLSDGMGPCFLPPYL